MAKPRCGERGVGSFSGGERGVARLFDGEWEGSCKQLSFSPPKC